MLFFQTRMNQRGNFLLVVLMALFVGGEIALVMGTHDPLGLAAQAEFLTRKKSSYVLRKSVFILI